MNEYTKNEPKTEGGSVTVALPRKPSNHAAQKGTWEYTYFVQRGNAIKIGHSAIPKQRISGLQVSFAERLEILAIVPNTIISEAAAHEQFAHLRISGEWFRAEPDLIEFILALKLQIEAPAKPKNEAAALGAKALVKQLHALRTAHGHNTPMGHAASNLAEIAPLLVDYERPAWAAHESQTLPYLANKQLKIIERLKAASH